MRIKADTSLKDQSIEIPLSVAELHGVSNKSSDNHPPYINLKYFDGDYQCFSELDKDDLKAFSDSVQKLGQMTWTMLKRQAGKSKKTGFAPTQISRDQLPQRAVLNRISEDVSFIELRLSKKARMFGFRSSSGFFLLFLDRNHKNT